MLKRSLFHKSKGENIEWIIKVCNNRRIEVNDFSRGQYSGSKNIGFKISMLRSDLYDYNDACIVVKEREYVLQVVIMLTEEINGYPLRIIIHLHHAYQITHL